MSGREEEEAPRGRDERQPETTGKGKRVEECKEDTGDLTGRRRRQRNSLKFYFELQFYLKPINYKKLIC